MKSEAPVSNEVFENNLPYDIEQIEPLKLANPEVKDGSLFINSKKQNQYKDIYSKIEPQHNNQDIIRFPAYRGDTFEDKDFGDRAINVNEPEKELLNVQRLPAENSNNRREVIVNGRPWNSLNADSEQGFKIEVDPLSKTVVANTYQEVIVNNTKWQTQFKKDDRESFHFATCYNGTTYAIGGRKLFINDREWASNNIGGDSVENAVINKNKKVAALINGRRGDRTDELYCAIVTGDLAGEKYVWNNRLFNNSKMAIDDESGRVAVFGNKDRQENKCLIVDDISYDISANPKELDYLGFKDGNVVIQYKNALGETECEMIKLKENAPELEEQRKKEKEFDSAVEEFRKMLMGGDVSLTGAVERVSNSGKLKDELKKSKENELAAGKINNALSDQINKLEMQLKNAGDDISSEKNNKKESEAKLTNVQASLKSVAEIVGKSKKGILGSYSISVEDMNKIKNLLG